MPTNILKYLVYSFIYSSSAFKSSVKACVCWWPAFNSNTLRLWKLDEKAKRVNSTETHIGVNRRIVRNIQVQEGRCAAGVTRCADSLNTLWWWISRWRGWWSLRWRPSFHDAFSLFHNVVLRFLEITFKSFLVPRRVPNRYERSSLTFCSCCCFKTLRLCPYATQWRI